MQTAQRRDAVRNGMFYFRKDLQKRNAHLDLLRLMISNNFFNCTYYILYYCDILGPSADNKPDESEYELMSVNTIINGKVCRFLTSSLLFYG